MPTLKLDEEQVGQLVEQLPASAKIALLVRLVRSATATAEAWEGALVPEVRRRCEEEGQDWGSMSEEERAWRYLDAVARGQVRLAEEQLPDPEVLVNEGLGMMKERQIANRELAVRVITHKNYLESLREQEQRLCARLEAEAAKAEREQQPER